MRGVPKPDFIQAVHWLRDGVLIRAEEMTLIDAATVSDSYVPHQTPILPEQWWSSLDTALKNLARTRTARVSLVQADIDQSIADAFSATIDTRISQWVIGHGDLHWANVTAPRLFLLDWDAWGLMPKGLDAAKLWEAAYQVPSFADEIAARLAPDLETRDGRIITLWVCANRILGAQRRGNITDQTEHAYRTGRRLLHRLAT